MALFEDQNEYRCPNCGMSIFIERPSYIYKKEKGRIKDIVIRTKVADTIQCSNPKCNTLFDKKNLEFFKDTEEVDSIN